MAPVPKSRWEIARHRFRTMRPAEWPEEARKETDRERAAREENEHRSLWEEIATPERHLQRLTNLSHEGLSVHVATLAYRVTRALAMLSCSVMADQLLAAAPDSIWDQPLQIPSGLVQVADSCHLTPWPDPIAFQASLLAIRPGLALGRGTPCWHVYDYLVRDPDRLASVWPRPEEILEFEALLCEATQDIVKSRGQLAAIRRLQRQFLMGPSEAKTFVTGACYVFKEIGRIDPDTERGIALARSDEFYRRARAAGNLREEGQAIKLHAAISGLTRGNQVEPEKETDFLTVLKKATTPTTHALPPPASPKPLDDQDDEEDSDA